MSDELSHDGWSVFEIAFMRMLPDRWEGKSKVSGMYSLKSIEQVRCMLSHPSHRAVEFYFEQLSLTIATSVTVKLPVSSAPLSTVFLTSSFIPWVVALSTT